MGKYTNIDGLGRIKDCSTIDGLPIPDHPNAPIQGPSVWYGSELGKQEDKWIYRFSDKDIDELDNGLRIFQRSGASLTDLSPKNFPLPKLEEKLKNHVSELLHGRGFILYRGLPINGRTMTEIIALYLGITARFGHPRPQNAKGDLIGHVRDEGGNPAQPSVRIYQTKFRQTFHTDSADLVSLLCIQQAKKGGLSSIVSSHTIFNEIYNRKLDLIPVLFQPFPTDRRGDIPTGMLPYFLIPIYHWHAGYLSAIYSRTYIYSSQRMSEAPRLSPIQIEAMELVHSLAEDARLQINMAFEQGDIQILNNHQLLHDRTAFKDWPDPARKRHLLRIWLCPQEGRPLPDVYAQRYGTTKIGDRGGIYLPHSEITVRLD